MSPRYIAPASAAVAFLLTTATTALTIPFAVVLTRAGLPACTTAIISSCAGLMSLASITLLSYDYRRNPTHVQTPPRQLLWKRIQVASGVVYLIWVIATFATLIWMEIRLPELPETIAGSPKQNILVVTFILCGLSFMIQITFLVFAASKPISPPAQSLHTIDDEPNMSEMQQKSPPCTAPSSRGSESVSFPVLDSSPSRGRSRAGSDALDALRASLTQVVRPISSKSRLISSKISYRSPSLDSGTGEREMALEDGFDSWDTSAVDPQSRQTVMNSSTSSPVPARFLETIPASPTGSRSPSPGFPLDLQPPNRSRQRSRSHSPAASFREVPRRSRAASPAPSEAHIHPLFRTDSSEPPPTVTPGTVVTAAPGAGQLIADRRTIHRMRSGSLPTSPSPLSHSNSMDDLHRGGSSESGRTSPPERAMTPPIPDWIMGAGARNSLTGYSRRKVAPGLGPVGEVRES
jgi:hypothetical protein